MNRPKNRLDAAETSFFRGELDYVKSKAYEAKHKNLRATELIPVSLEAHAGADTVSFRKYDMVGVAKIVSDYANDFPRVDVYGKKETAQVRSLGASYGYSIKEIRRAKDGGQNLEARKAVAARRAIDEQLEKIAFLGDAKYNLNGLLNYPGITEHTIVNNGAGNSKLWTNKTADEIVADVAGILGAVATATSGMETPDTVLIPDAHFRLIQTKRMGTDGAVTVLEYLRRAYPEVTFERFAGLTGAGAGGTNRLFAYVRSPEYLSLEIPQAFEQFEPQQHGLEFEVPVHMETAGVIMYYPLSAAYADGI